MSHLDPRIQVYLFQIINDVFDGIVLKRVIWVNLHNVIYNGPVKNHDIQEENAWQ
jgi:hypothetical protein